MRKSRRDDVVNYGAYSWYVVSYRTLIMGARRASAETEPRSPRRAARVVAPKAACLNESHWNWCAV